MERRAAGLEYEKKVSGVSLSYRQGDLRGVAYFDRFSHVPKGKMKECIEMGSSTITLS